jgi:hypothetical protein
MSKTVKDPKQLALQALSREICSALTPAGVVKPEAEAGILSLLLASREVQAGTIPSAKDVQRVAETIWSHTGGDGAMLKFIGRVEQTWAGCQRNYFQSPTSLWEDMNGYRQYVLKPAEAGYLQLLKDGEDVAPDFVACPEAKAGPTWCKGPSTIVTTLPTVPGKGLRLGYDAEDVPPLLALSVLSYAGYELPESILKQIQTYRTKFTKTTGIDFDKECQHMVRYVEFDPTMKLQERGLLQLIEKHVHFFDMSTAEGDGPGDDQPFDL